MKNDGLQLSCQQANAIKIKELRKSRQESQYKFWRRFGVTQSRGSRFEQGLDVPVSIAILVRLYLDGKVSDEDLWCEQKGANSSGNTGLYTHA